MNAIALFYVFQKKSQPKSVHIPSRQRYVPPDIFHTDMYLQNTGDDSSIGKTMHVPVLPPAVPAGATQMGSASTKGSTSANLSTSADITSSIKSATFKSSEQTKSAGNNNEIPTTEGSETLPTTSKASSEKLGAGDMESSIEQPCTPEVTASGGNQSTTGSTDDKDNNCSGTISVDN